MFSNEIRYSSESPIPRSTLLESDHDDSLTHLALIFMKYIMYTNSHVVIVSPPLGVLGPFYELQVPFYRHTYAQIK